MEVIRLDMGFLAIIPTPREQFQYELATFSSGKSRDFIQALS